MQLKKGGAILLASLSFIVTINAFAIPIKNLYTASLVVPDRTEAARDAVLPQGLLQVLVKVTGNGGLSTLPAVSRNLKNAKAWMVSYRYTMNAQHQLVLQAHFDAKAVNMLLKKQGQVLWGRERPLIAAWIAVQQGEERSFVESNAGSLFYNQFTTLAENRGLPFTIPLFDLTDLNQIAFSDLWALDAKKIESASQRYSQKGILMGHVERTSPDQWQGTWRLSLNGEQFDWTTQGNSFEAVVSNEFNNLTETFASRYSVIENNVSKREIILEITGISNLMNYSEVTRYLQNLTPVKQVTVSALAEQSVTYQVVLKGSIQALEQALQLGDHLTAVKTNEDGSLVYRWS